MRRAHERFVSLIRDTDAYMSTTGGEMVLDHGRVVADLTARLGLSPATISEIQGVVRELSRNLRQVLSALEERIGSAREGLSRLQGGDPSPELREELRALGRAAAELRGKLASLEKEVEGARR